MSHEWIQATPGELPSSGFYRANDDLPVFSERRLQGLVPKKRGYYAQRTHKFIDGFAGFKDIPNLVADYDGIYLVGEDVADSNLFDFVYSYIHPEREWIESLSGKSLDGLYVFLGRGIVMDRKYRSVGRTKNGPFPLAIAGANSCYYNTDGKDEGELRLEHRVRAIRHEFRHTGINHAIAQITGVQYATDRNKVVHEATGGPDKYYWQIAEIPHIRTDVEILDHTTDFWEWYNEQRNKHNCHEEFFQNPVTKSFYLDYVYAQGDSNHWFHRALDLATKAT